MKKPVLLVIMDGVGLTDTVEGNAVKNAYTPNLDHLLATCPNIEISAHGKAVGLPTDNDMGNSEVGHNAIGCGQIYSQGAALVSQSIEDKSIFKSETWNKLVNNSKNSSLHLIGLLSDGNVHSHINHIKELIKHAKVEGLKQVYLHVLLDGRDVEATSALKYIDEIETLNSSLNDSNFNVSIASGGGRMKITMDRYNADWSMVEAGWKTHVLGDARGFNSAKEAIETYRSELDCIDQDLPSFVITKDNKAIGTIQDGDSVIFFNFRGDRALEISNAFEQDEFTHFDRIRRPKVMYAGMLQYDGDLLIPNLYLVAPPKIKNTMSEHLAAQNVPSFSISETQKFGHVTYFFNGNRSEKFNDKLETWVEVKSDVIPFEQRPWMKSAEITDTLIKELNKCEYDFYRVNFPNGDMVGHTGSYLATIIGVESVDLAIGRLIKVCDEKNITLIVTADHGNADEMYEKRKNPTDPIRPKTSHTLNKVPFIIYNHDVTFEDGKYGLSNIAATVFKLLNLKIPSMWNKPMIK